MVKAIIRASHATSYQEICAPIGMGRRADCGVYRNRG